MPPIASRQLVVTMAAFLAAGWLSTSPQPTLAAGFVSLSPIDSAYAQSFDTLNTLGTANAINAAPGMGGWDLTESGGSARDNEQYGANTGSSGEGDTYSYGTSAALLDRALGGLRAPALAPVFGAAFTNDTGETIAKLDVAYTGEMFRAGVLNRNAADRIDFQLSLDATSLTTGTWTNYDDLDFASPTVNTTVGAKDANAPAFRTELSLQITDLAIVSGASFWVRWTDFDITGPDDGLAVDDFSITPRADDDVAPEVSATIPAEGDEEVAVDANLSVTFSEPVDVSSSTFEVNCTSSGTHSIIVSGGPTTFTIDPNDDFVQHEYCTLTVDDAGVTDTDASDPPDTLAADVTSTFRVANPPPVFEFVAGAACSPRGGSFVVNVHDLEMDPGSLTLALSGNTSTTLVPNANVAISGAANRTIAVTVASRQTGSGLLTFTLSDGVNDVAFVINVRIGTDADDTMTGTAGADLIAGNQGDDTLSGLGGIDVLCGGNGSDTLAGGDGNDALSGDKGNDSLSGGEGDDVIGGGPGIDALNGDGGDDSLVGNEGDDSLTGGADADAFSGGGGADTNTDFNAGDGDTSDGT